MKFFDNPVPSPVATKPSNEKSSEPEKQSELDQVAEAISEFPSEPDQVAEAMPEPLPDPVAKALPFESKAVEKAAVLNQHGLTQEAKSELIDVIFSTSDDSSKAEAYYMLGSIAFDESRVSVALDSWRELVKKYPNSTQAQMVKDRIDELAEIVGESTKRICRQCYCFVIFASWRFLV